MDWTAQVDAYCERLGPGYWAEPLNAATNAAFLIAALVMWRRTAGQGAARLLCAVLFVIGIGSFLFHTEATVWASVADTTPIGVFILVYTWAANRYFWGLPPLISILGAAIVVPWMVLLTPLFAGLPWFSASAIYWPVPLLIGLYALALSARAPATAGGLGLGVAILVASLVARSLDGALCGVIPFGTHWLWHLLNALMLGWMIEVLRRHLAGGGGRG